MASLRLMTFLANINDLCAMYSILVRYGPSLLAVYDLETFSIWDHPAGFVISVKTKIRIIIKNKKSI